MFSSHVFIAAIFVISIAFVTRAQDEEEGARSGEPFDCFPGYFGANCSGMCHCLNGPDQCDPRNSVCQNYLCDRGWTGSPYCQTECLEGAFGVDCAEECHCPEGDVCNKVNGICGGGRCHVDWTGPGCQTRLPKLTSIPVVVNVTCEEFVLVWTTWSETVDLGDPPVGTYTIQQNLNDSSWTDYGDVTAPEGANELSLAFSGVDPYTFYNFRIRANRLDFGKLVPGSPGPTIEAPIRPLEECIFPTTAPPPPPTTTASPSTTTVPDTTTTAEPTTTTALPTTTTALHTTAEPETTTTDKTTPEVTTTEVTTTTIATTTTLPPPPSAVSDLTIILDGQDGVLVTWTPPADSFVELIAYNVSYQMVGVGDCNDSYSELPVALRVSPGSRRVMIRGLAPWRQYEFSIVAANIAGDGQQAMRRFYSRETAPQGQVENVQVVSRTTHSLILRWDDVPCPARGGVLRLYDVFVADRLVTPRTREVIVTSLQPHTSYTVRVRYVNSMGDGPLSEPVTVTTRQDVPPSPTSLTVVNMTESTMFLTWAAPDPPNGVLVNYRIYYRIAGTEDTETTLTMGASNTHKMIVGLLPFSTYDIQVKSRTQTSDLDGWGNRSEVLTAVTSDGEPSAPLQLQRASRTETCVSVEWEPPATPNGVITNYMISYRRVPSDIEDTTVELDGETLFYTACKLATAAQYRFSVQASTRARYGGASLLDVWTEVGVPTIPPSPVVRATTSTTVTIRIQPVVLTPDTVSGYFVVLEEIDETPDDLFRRRKRALPDPVGTIPLPGTTVAFLDRSAVSAARTFVVGDGNVYGDYTNTPLTRGALYNIYFVVTSSLDGSTKMSFSQIVTPVRAEIGTSTLAVPTTTPTTTPSTTTVSTTTTTTTTPVTTPLQQTTTRKVDTTTFKITTPEVPRTTPKATTTEIPQTTTTPEERGLSFLMFIIVIVVPVAVVIIIIIIVIVCCCLRKNRRKTKETNKMESSWINYYTAHYSDDNKRGNWSDIYDLKEPRHITINEKKTYMPDDIKVADIQDRSKLSVEYEYSQLPQGKKFQWQVAERHENQEKNRFDHILAYDHSRVVLKQRGPSDYINANYVISYEKPNAYIAAQSPFSDETIADFWLMVYQENCSQILFLANIEEDGIIKSEEYWPTNRKNEEYGRIHVTLTKTDYFANFVVRSFELCQVGGGQVNCVSQYHFTAWPDHGVPEDPIPLLEFRMKVRTCPRYGVGGPMVVHCGTGVSRTAVFIALDALLEQAKVENCVNVFKFCNKMRKARVLMVRTLKQYRFIYDTLLEALLTNYNVVGDDLKVNYRLLSKVNPITNKSLFKEQFEVMEEFTPLLPQDKCKLALLDENVMKNRFKSIVPPDENRPVLLTPGGLNRTDYINAMYVDSYTLEGAFVVTQTPLMNTVIDFWKLVFDCNINCIVMLNGSHFKEDTCADYMPKEKNASQKYDPFFVRLADVVRTDHVTVRTLELASAHKPSEPQRIIRQFQFESWEMYEKTPWSREGFIKLIEMVNDWLDESEAGDSPILVHCMDGASQSGLFCACSVICEKMMLEGEVDIFHTVKHMKRRRKHFLSSLEQYKFSFKLLWDYMNTRLDRQVISNGHVNFSYDGDSDEVYA